MTSAEARITALYDAFNGRDFDDFFERLAPEADWPNEIDNTRVLGKDAIRAYMLNETAALRAAYTTLYMRALSEDRVAVIVQQVITSAHDGSMWSKTLVRHVFQLKDGLVSRMDAEQGGCGAELTSPWGQLLARLNDATERQDIEAVMTAFHPQATIPDHLEQTTITGHPEIRACYLRQFETIRVAASLLWLQRLSEDRLEAISQVQVHGVDGGFWWEGAVRVDYRIQDGQIAEMDVAEHLARGD
jgi:hypothetical protein